MLTDLRRRLGRLHVRLIERRLRARPEWAKWLEAVRRFYTGYPDFRLIPTCSRATGLDAITVYVIREYLYRERLLGGYVFGAGEPPQAHMRTHLLDVWDWLGKESHILEVGPGEHPVFPPAVYPNWQGIDRNFDGTRIDFRGQHWTHAGYAGRIVTGGWETLSRALPKERGAYDLVVGSHSYEHVFQPIQSLIEARAMLRPGGALALFVPDGFSDDPASRGEPTHTVYVVPDMAQEFFRYAGGFRNLSIEPFRPNFDLVITAEKE